MFFHVYIYIYVIFIASRHGRDGPIRKTMVLKVKETLLCHLQRAARAETIPKYNEAVYALKSLTLWKENPKLQNWLNNIWLRICKVICLVKYSM